MQQSSCTTTGAGTSQGPDFLELGSQRTTSVADLKASRLGYREATSSVDSLLLLLPAKEPPRSHNVCVPTPLPKSRTLATNSDRSLSALWGKLASEILMEQWEVATDDLMKLREIIDSDSFAPILQQLQQRTWLMHWSLYIFFNHDNGRNQIIDLFFQDRCAALSPRQLLL